MKYTVAKRGWVLLDEKNKIVAQGNKADIEKAAFEKVLAGHTVTSEGESDEPELPAI